ncbi:hypothetical protein [Sorangium sp. So ce131]|uniref:hypothetical protein n=1 Tax=Sorangium sp. So ce131 TaxID=3133282 RepID=UPI003F6361F6
MTTVLFPSWYLRGLGDELLVVQPFEAPRPPHHDVLPSTFVLGYLERWLGDPDARRVLLDIHARLCGGLSLGVWAYDEVERDVRPVLVAALERRDLVVLTRRPVSVPAPGEPVGTVPSERIPTGRPQEVGTTFIEIVLMDQAGVPVAGGRFRITLPDGTVREGRLATNGFVRIDGIEPGECEIEFPDLDGREWGPQ